jgi:glycosyltransferase involved in cell wall biosynthesis
MNPNNRMKKVSLIVPVYFEQECIAQFIKETTDVLHTINYDYEIVFIDDGSQDNTVDIIKEHANKNSKIKLLEFSYNHGKQAAVTAGIANSTGDYCIYMDPDLQDPPVEIPRFINEIEKGYNLVFGVRKEKVDGFLNKLFSKLFWYVLEKFTGLKLPKGLAVMRIFDRKFANTFLQYNEQNRFIEGIFMHIGMKSTSIQIEQRERFAGTSKFNFRKKMKLAFDAIFDFSEIPLKLAVKLGLYLTIIGFVFLLLIIIAKLLSIEFQTGWASLISALVLGFGLQLFFIGIAAIYIGRTYKEVKKRPLFSIKQTTNI